MYLVYFCCMIKKNKYLTDKEEEDYLKSKQFVEDTKRIIMENKEYYTPTVEEFYVGFEYERCDDGYKYFKDIFPRAVDLNIFYTNPERYLSYFRVKFLCKQDIIDLNWEFIGDLDNNIHFKKGNYLLNLHKTNGNFKNAVEILFAAPTGMCIFRGIVKSKNELKKLMKDYLNISI